jgi:hypothetical protein
MLPLISNVGNWWEAAVFPVDLDLTTNPKNHVVVHFIKAAGFVGHLGPELSLCRRFSGLLPRGGDDKHVFGVR